MSSFARMANGRSSAASTTRSCRRARSGRGRWRSEGGSRREKAGRSLDPPALASVVRRGVAAVGGHVDVEIAVGVRADVDVDTGNVRSRGDTVDVEAFLVDADAGAIIADAEALIAFGHDPPVARGQLDAGTVGSNSVGRAAFLDD